MLSELDRLSDDPAERPGLILAEHESPNPCAALLPLWSPLRTDPPPYKATNFLVQQQNASIPNIGGTP